MQITFLPIILAIVASMILGMVWYSPFAFGAIWMGLVGVKKENVKKGKMWVPLLSSVISAFLIAFAVETISGTFLERLVAATFVWLVFGQSLNLQHFLYEKRSMKLFFLQAGHELVNLIVICFVISLFV